MELMVSVHGRLVPLHSGLWSNRNSIVEEHGGEICSHCKRRARERERGKRKRGSWDKLPLPFTYLLPTTFKGICLFPPTKTLFHHHIMNTFVVRVRDLMIQPKNLRPGIRIS